MSFPKAKLCKQQKNFESQEGKHIFGKYSSTIEGIKTWSRKNSWWSKTFTITLSKNYIFILTDTFLYINEYPVHTHMHMDNWNKFHESVISLILSNTIWCFLFNLSKNAGWIEVWVTLLVFEGLFAILLEGKPEETAAGDYSDKEGRHSRMELVSVGSWNG